MNIIQVEFATPEYDETIALRYKILREPLGLEFTEEQLAFLLETLHATPRRVQTAISPFGKVTMPPTSITMPSGIGSLTIL